MKKVLLSAVAILAIAGAANATLIGLEWTTPGQESAPVAANTPVTAQFYLTKGNVFENDVTLQGIGIILHAYEDAALTIPATNLFQVSVTPHVAGWSVAPANQNEQLNGLQFAAIATPGSWTPDSGKTIVMDINIEYTGNPAPGTKYYITLDNDSNYLGIDVFNYAFSANAGVWDSRAGYADTYSDNWAYGDWGNPGWSRIVKGVGEVGQVAPNPLILVTPEPASLALLALGGFAALRRR